MTFYYHEDKNEIEGNNMFYEGSYGPLARRDGESLYIDVDEMMKNGRGVNKLKEMRSAINDAIEANESE